MNGFSELLLFTSLHASLWALVKSLGEEKPSEKQPCLVSGLEGEGERLQWRFALTGLHITRFYLLCVCVCVCVRVCVRALVCSGGSGKGRWGTLGLMEDKDR